MLMELLLAAIVYTQALPLAAAVVVVVKMRKQWEVDV